MVSPLIALLCATLLDLASTSRAITCSPPVSTNVSFANLDLSSQGGSLPPGPMELGLDGSEQNFLFWVPVSAVGKWNLVPSDSDLFLIQHTDVPNLSLTVIQAAGGAQLSNRTEDSRQKWNVTCTTCPESGFANNCTFKNTGDQPAGPSGVQTEVCILNERLKELGNATIIGDCTPSVLNLTINYHL
ncbi:hypothetical protein B0H15DRAFT_1023945 [Mycena belliarum]|uniref:Uncharacterized protein n=1 Tax=Mycena belliarum TaxID=1033014 RepID=A0AAD6U426_9AGAR|nr:hypothetical protein B0H15DRAFT_1023945 [Mycena belliae]